MCEIKDEQLVNDYKATGETCHFDQLVHRHISKVRAMIYHMVLNDADADELTQEVFLKAYNGISKFRGRSAFSSWLYRITMNTVNSFLRKKIRSPLFYCADLPEMSDRSPTPSERFKDDEFNLQVEKVLASLSPVLRSAITLTAIHGMKVKDAAKADGCLVSTMYWRVHKAREFLKQRLDIKYE